MNHFIFLLCLAIKRLAQETAQETVCQNLSDRILKLLEENSKYTRNDLARILGKADGTIRNHLANLKESGRLKRIGSTKAGYWEVIDNKK